MGKRGGEKLTENLCSRLHTVVEVMIFWDIPPCSLVDMHRRFGKSRCFHFEVISLFCHEGWQQVFLWNVIIYQTTRHHITP
jgi:hypothetical protein